MMPSSVDLTYFVEIAGTLNLSRASERLGISQPSLSLSIQRLEHSIGAKLFIRSKRGVQLTQAGKQLLIQARALLQQWELIKGKAVSSMDSVQGFYTIGCHQSVGIYSLPLFLPLLLEEYPNLEFRVVHDLSRKIVESIIKMEIDVGIVVNPTRHPDLIINKLCDDEVTFWVGNGNRSIQDFKAGKSVLICEPNLIQTQDLISKLKKAQIKYKRLLTTSNLELITELTASGAGIGIIPGRVVGSSKSKGLKRIPNAPTFKDEICLVYRVENRVVETIKVMSEAIQIAFKKPIRDFSNSKPLTRHKQPSNYIHLAS